MGNKTYAMGDMEISPTLTKADYDELNQYMTKMFGAWPHWVTEKPEWGDATIILKNEGVVGRSSILCLWISLAIPIGERSNGT